MSAAGTAAEGAPAPSPWAVTGVVMLGMMMSIIDASIVNVSIPHMMGTLGAGVSEISWVVSAYALANVILIPLSAWLASVVGRSRLYGAAIVVFTLASVACGLAPTLGLLVAARVAQGAAAGILMPTGQAILYESFPPERRGSSMAIFGLGVMVGPAVGPTLGGWITDNYGWPWIFYVNLPVGIVGALLVPLVLRDPPYLQRRTSARGDVLGIVLLASGLAIAQYVLESGADDGWFQADWVVLSTVGAVLLLVGFAIWELGHPDPAVELRIFSDPTFRTACLVNVAVGVGLMGGMFVLPLFLQQLLGFTATQSGMLLVPGALATAAAMPICGRLADRTDPRLLTGFGLVVFAISMWTMSLLDHRAGASDLLLPQILRGIGMGFCFVPLSVAAMSRVPRERMGQATGLFNLTRQVGGSMGVAWLGSLVGRLRTMHASFLASGMSVYDPEVRSTLAATTAGLTARNVANPQQVALASLYGRVSKAAAELAFRDMFLIVAGLFLLALPLLMLLRRRSGDGPAPAMAHAAAE